MARLCRALQTIEKSLVFTLKINIEVIQTIVLIKINILARTHLVTE